MPSRRRDPERGSSLILALAMVTIISVAIVAVLGYAATSFRTVTTIREQRDRAYAADGAVETAIASLRKVADEGAVGPDDPRPALPCTGLDYAAVGKAPAITVSCEVVGARGPGIPGDTMPPYALWSVGGNIDAGGTTLYVGGPVSSSGSINVGTLDASGYIVQSAGGCSGTIVVLDPDDNQCGGQSAARSRLPVTGAPRHGRPRQLQPATHLRGAEPCSSGPGSTPKRARSRIPTTAAAPTGSSTSAPACTTSTSGSPTTTTCGTWATPRSWAANRRAGTPTAERPVARSARSATKKAPRARPRRTR